MVRLFLIGYSGAGKTTLGRAFARSTGLDFIDLDWYIEQRFHTDIQTLFATRGEEGFRRIEHNLLHEVGEFENVVISCGGGTPCYADNIDYMLSGKSDDELREAIRQACAERQRYYGRAKYMIDSDLLEDRAEIAGTVARLKAMLQADGVLPKDE